MKYKMKDMLHLLIWKETLKDDADRDNGDFLLSIIITIESDNRRARRQEVGRFSEPQKNLHAMISRYLMLTASILACVRSAEWLRAAPAILHGRYDGAGLSYWQGGEIDVRWWRDRADA